MGWVPIPNKQDGDGYTAIMAMPDGPEIYGAWIACILVASKCDPRGTLLRDCKKPHTSHSLARMSHFPATSIQKMLDALSSPDINWLESVDYDNPAPECGEVAPSCDNPAPECGPSFSSFSTVPSVPSSKAEEVKDVVVPTPSADPVLGLSVPDPVPTPAPERLKDLPEHLNTARMNNRWQVWMTARRGFKKPKSWVALFNEQIDWLATYDEATAHEILSKSIRNGYQGLLEPNTRGNGGPTWQAGRVDPIAHPPHNVQVKSLTFD